MLLLSQVVLFLSVNGHLWSVELFKIQMVNVHQGSVAEYVDELSKSVNTFFCSTHLRVQAERYTAQRNSVKDVAKNVDFVENFTSKINCLGKSVYWAYNQVTFCTARVWRHG